LTIYSAIGFCVAMLILAASPGPGVFATVARALASGFRPALAVIGGIVLGDIIFLLFAAFGLSISGTQDSDTRSKWGNFVSGLVITLSNPKVILFYCGFLPTFLDLSTLTVFDLAIVVAIITAVLVCVLGTYAYLASRARQMFTQKRSVRRLNRAAGSVMVAAGVAIAVRS